MDVPTLVEKHPHARSAYACGLLTFLLALPVAGQTPENTVVIHGRVEDASRQPLQALVISGDSSTSVFADSLGNFSIPLNASAPYVLHAEDFGYQPTTFELPETAPAQLSILILDPLEGVNLVADDALAALSSRLTARRETYLGLVSVYDRDRLLGVEAETALQLVQQRSVGYECPVLPGELCVTFRDQEARLLVCIDELRPSDTIAELRALPIESIISAEFYGPTVGLGLYNGAGLLYGGAPILGTNPIFTAGQIRIYTRPWMVSTAGQGDRALTPTGYGC